MAISKISGSMLQSNLVRDGNSLAFLNNANSIPTLYLDVANGVIGINTSTPQANLDIVGNMRVDSITTHTANSDITIGPDGTGTINLTNNVSVNGNVTADNFFGNIQLPNNISITGNVTANNFFGNSVSVSGNITAGTFLGKVPASDRQLFVATNGSDANDGNLNQPFLTIKAAMAAAAAIGGSVSVNVAPGNYTEDNPVTIPANVSLMGDNLRNVFIYPATPSADLFYVSAGCYVWGITIRDYLANGFSYNPNIITTAFVSPYIQNLTSNTTTGTAVFIDGAACGPTSTKAMIVGFFTMINKGGIGIKMVNQSYSQLVNIYSIACDIGVKVESGSFCTLNGSDCSIGNYGLWADGYGEEQTTATIESQFQGVFVLDNLSNGQPHVNTLMFVDGDPQAYTIDTIIPNIPTVGKSTVVVQQIYLGNAAPGTSVAFYVRSSIIASAHTFEYVGAGINPATALPQYGGIPIEANEVLQTNYGVVTYTSTDQKGNFKVGDGFTISQATGTITGQDFYRSLFAQMTPFILALSEG